MPWRVVICWACLILAQRVMADEPTRCVQEELRRRNLYFGEIDGRFNPELRGALRRYQERKNLAVTGEIDGDTARSLNVPEAIAPRPTDPPWPDIPILKSDAAREASAATAESPATLSPPSAAPSPPPPAESPAGVQNLTPNELTRLVEDYLRDAQSDDVELQVRYYAFPVRYFDHGPVDRSFVMRDTADYLKRWPSRSYRLTGPVTFVANPAGDEIEVQFPISFTVRNAKHDVHGRTTNFWTLRSQKSGELKIIAIREQRLRD